MFENVTHERSLILIISKLDPNISKQSKFTNHKIIIIKDLALEKYTPEGYKKSMLLYH